MIDLRRCRLGPLKSYLWRRPLSCTIKDSSSTSSKSDKEDVDEEEPEEEQMEESAEASCQRVGRVCTTTLPTPMKAPSAAKSTL